ncbi:hypothetical protein Tco_0557197 [Tanacetum coccineum]
MNMKAKPHIQQYAGLILYKLSTHLEMKLSANNFYGFNSKELLTNIIALDILSSHARIIELQQSGRLTVKKLKQHVKNHWIMAGTGSPQFITACSATTSASGDKIMNNERTLTILGDMCCNFKMIWSFLKEH